MKELFNRLYKVLIVVMIFIWGIITFSSCFHIYGRYYNPLIIILGAFLLFIFIYNINKLIRRINPKYHDKIALGMFILSLTLMLLWGLNNEIIPSYDLSHIIAKTDLLLNNNHFFGSELYFSIYPTQIPLTIYIYGIKALWSLFNITNLNAVVIIYNAIMTSLMFFIIYKIVKKLSNSHLALIVMLLAMLYPDFYLYIPYYYTDIMALPFGIIGFYLLLLGDSKKNKRSLLYYLLAGILFGIGFKLRVTTVIILIAYLICLFRKPDFKQIAKKSIFIFTGLILTLFTYSKIIYPSFNIEIDETVKVPPLHWVMMGTNPETDGGYDDAAIIYSIYSQDKNKDIINVIKDRIPKLTPKFYYNKLRKVWSEGDHDIQRKYALTKSMSESRNFVNGQMSGILRYYSQMLKFTIYTLFLITIINELKKKNDFENSKIASIIIAVFGGILFYLLWEALSRYSFSFLPLIIIGTYKGIELLSKNLNCEEIKFKNKTYNLHKFKKVLGIILILGLIIGLIIGFNYAAKNKEIIELERNLQRYSSKTYEPLYNKTLKQVFRVRDSFNRVQLKVMTNNVTEDLIYNYEIYNSKNELIYEGEYGFDPKNTRYIRKITLYVPTVKVTKEEEFYVLLYSESAKRNNHIKINTFKYQNIVPNDPYFSPETLGPKFDLNPNAETYFDNALYYGDAYLRVIEKTKRPFVKKSNYIILSMLSIIFVGSNIYCGLIKKGKNETK